MAYLCGMVCIGGGGEEGERGEVPGRLRVNIEIVRAMFHFFKQSGWHASFRGAEDRQTSHKA